ncbi:hypothetical protein KI387_042640, partial [Taxus chinensis]
MGNQPASASVGKRAESRSVGCWVADGECSPRGKGISTGSMMGGRDDGSSSISGGMDRCSSMGGGGNGCSSMGEKIIGAPLWVEEVMGAPLWVEE